jgi:isopentenyl-diphosphate Delta-isomerase
MTSADGLADQIRSRKLEHLDLAMSAVNTATAASGWADVHLVHDALPDIDAADVGLGTTFLGHELALPLMVVGMTGGHPDAAAINAALADAAAGRGLAIGVGSQRAALRDTVLESTYAIVRERARDGFVIANVGISQLLDQPGEPRLGAAEIERMIAMIDADAIAVHLNYVEELVQPEGQTRASGAQAALTALIADSPVPVIVKEVGSGLSRGLALRLRDAGAAAVDVGGLGGTSFAAIEAERAEGTDDAVRAALGRSLADWGIPTAASVIACSPVLPTIATGGVRDGVDAGKALALGASIVGVGRPLLEAAAKGPGAVMDWIDVFTEQLGAVVFLTGARSVLDLAGVPHFTTGTVRRWADHFAAGDPM